MGTCSSLWREPGLGIVVIAFEKPDRLAKRLVRGCRRGDESSLRASAALIERRLWVRGWPRRPTAIVPLRVERDVPLARALARQIEPGLPEEGKRLTFRLAVTDVLNERRRADLRKRAASPDAAEMAVAAILNE